MRQKVLRVRINSDSAMAKIDYDSERDEEPPHSMEILSDLVGAEFEYKTDDRGKAVEFKPPESLDLEALNKMGTDTKSMFERMPFVLPEGPVGVDDTWESDSSMAMGPMGQFKFKTTYKLTKIAGGKAWVASTIAIELDGMQQEAGLGVKLAYEDAKGTCVIDLNKGIIEDMESSMRMKMDMGTEESPVKMKMEGVAETRMRLTEPPTPKAPKQDASKPAPEPAPVKQESK